MDTVDGPNVQLVLGGDVMLGRGVADVVRRLGPAYPLEELQPLLGGCVMGVNLECAISSEPRQYSGPAKVFYFRADPASVEVLRQVGVRFVSLANNHALDADREGLAETLKILEKNQISAFGAGADATEAAASRVIAAGESRIGFLGACDHQRDFAATSAAGGVRIVDPADERELAQLERDVAALAPQVDAVIVAWHWQSNWEPNLRPVFRRAARRLVDAGANVIWGHGPHHFQGVERIGDAVVLYSTGDLVDDYATDPHFRNDYQLLFKLALQGRWESVAATVRAHPIELHYARTLPAGAEARQWIEPRFMQMCRALGTEVTREDGWLRVQ